jgi:hypothetical protein
LSSQSGKPFRHALFDVTILVQDWMTRAEINNGVMMKAGNKGLGLVLASWRIGRAMTDRQWDHL